MRAYWSAQWYVVGTESHRDRGHGFMAANGNRARVTNYIVRRRKATCHDLGRDLGLIPEVTFPFRGFMPMFAWAKLGRAQGRRVVL